MLGQALAVPQSPVGTYKPDLHLAPKPSKDPLQAVFGRSILRIGADGKFAFCGIRQSGFWRLHKGRLVLVYEGFMGTPFAVPDEVLKRTWPKDSLAGLVLSFRDPNTLELAKFGRVMGPIRFRRQPSKPTRLLVSESHKDEEATAEATYYELSDELARRWRELSDVVDAAAVPAVLRMWAAQIWHGPKTEEVGKAMVHRAQNLNTSGLTERQARTIRRTLGRNLAEFASSAAIPAMLELEAIGYFTRKDVAEAIGRTRHGASIPTLKEWLKSSGPYERGAAAEALAFLQAKDHLDLIRPMARDTEARARIMALSAILRLSDDPEEKEGTVQSLAEELKGEWLSATDAAEALGDSGSPSAVKPLVAALASGADMFLRRTAAEELGKLGFKEAIPALIEAKEGKRLPWVEDVSPKVRNDPDFARIERLLAWSLEDGPVRKAAAEALWKFDKRAKKA